MKATFRASDFEGNRFLDIYDCAMSRAMRRVEPTVKHGAGDGWLDNRRIRYFHTKAVQRLSERLSRLTPAEWASRKNPFIGKSFHFYKR